LSLVRAATRGVSLVAALLAAAAPTAAQNARVRCPASAPPPPSAGWRLIFRDEFSRGLTQWRRWSTGAFNEELQLYQPRNVRVSRGILVITPARDSARGPANPFDPTVRAFAFTSGRVESRRHFSVDPGRPLRISARIRLPDGYGMWPAFWTYGDPWPTQGEIDILEARGQEPGEFQTAYWYGERVNEQQVKASEQRVETGADLSHCWHVYEAEWYADSIVFRFDGAAVNSRSGDFVPRMVGKRQRVVLNVAVGGHFFTGLDASRIAPAPMEVDWVRVYQRVEGKPPETPSAPRVNAARR
jgi:beta-glucanase (GH16 family)